MTSSLLGQRTRSRPVLWDLFCCAGGIAMGYHRAGFEVIGFDVEPQPRYPFRFIQADALDVLRALVRGMLPVGVPTPVVAHASCPCQAHSDLQKQSKIAYEDFIARTRELLQAWGGPYVIENVEGAPLIDPVRVCGASPVFAGSGLRVIRHRLFESNVPLDGAPCPARHPRVFTYDKRKAHYGQLDQNTSFVQVTGGGNCTVANKASAMGIDWMTGRELNEAIPPAYGEHIGRQIISALAHDTTEAAAS